MALVTAMLGVPNSRVGPPPTTVVVVVVDGTVVGPVSI